MGFRAPTDLNGWIALGPSMGLNPATYVPPSMYADALESIRRNIKSPSNPPTAEQIAQGEACIIVRGLIYLKSNPGDCGTPTQLDLSNVQLTQSAGEIASGIASMAGAALPGIGVAVQAITEIFQHHAQAVAVEQTTLCAVAGVINQVIPYYDAQVAAGKISPSVAIQGVQNFINQVNAKLQTIYKSCNASCVYMSFLAAHADFLRTYYPAIAPIGLFSHAPGGSPSTATPTAPGGVIQVGGGVSLAGELSNVSASGFLVIAIITGIIIFLLAG